MEIYSEFRPTPYDPQGAFLSEERQDWLVAPVSRTRDTGAFRDSNFEVALELLGGEGEQVESHRFGHWGPGWFEIILVHPDLKDKLEEIDARLEDYPLLDEEDYSARCYEEAQICWDSFGAHDCRRELQKEFALADNTAEWFTNERLWLLYTEHGENPQHEDEGVMFDMDWIGPLRRDALAKWIWEQRKASRSAAVQE